AVIPCSHTAAASFDETPSGMTTADAAGTAARSAYDPRTLCDTTRSPTLNPLTPAPTERTTPAASEPSVDGSAVGSQPWRKYVSMKLTPVAATSTSNSSAPTVGSGASSRQRTSGPPVS